MQRYFINQAYDEQLPLKLVDNDYHHAVRVMRMTVGEQCFVSFTNQITFLTEVVAITETYVELKKIQQEAMLKEMPYHVSICCGYTKGDKMEWVAQKGTEMGMNELIGFPAQSSVVKWDAKKLAKKADRLTKICKEAAEQSHRQSLPNVQLLVNYKELLAQTAQFDAILVAYEESAKEGEQATFTKVITQLAPGSRVLVVFGPEGGLHPKEIADLEAHGAKLCGLGPRILRAETAPLYCLAAMSYAWELQG